jgi:hypothetical protein
VAAASSSSSSAGGRELCGSLSLSCSDGNSTGSATVATDRERRDERHTEREMAERDG